jgi:DNA processing protein
MNYQTDSLQRNKNIILHLNLILNIGPAAVTKIIESVGLEDLESLYQFAISDFIERGFSEQKAQALVDGLADKKLLQNELQLIEEHHVTIVTLWCSSYSKLLAEIHIPPVVLYCQGNTDLLRCEKMIACVGARKANIYARDAIAQIITPLLLDGWVVVSGGAAGADTYAHQTALDAQAGTIVVVGSGLCHQYPPSNKSLFERVIKEKGLIVSSFPMNVHPDLKTFPARNRIISGLSLGCLVVQAAARSGALITAQQALDQGREVFAIPGSIFDPLSVGCHELLAQGAKVTTCAQDIVSEFGQFELVQDVSGPQDEQLQMKIQNTVKAAESLKVIPALKVISAFQRKDPLEQAIVGLVSVPMSSDHLLAKTEVDLPQLQAALFSLSLDGVIFQDGMGFWSLK